MKTMFDLIKADMKNYIFFINMQMIVDGLTDVGIPCTFHNKGDQPRLWDIRFYKGQDSYRRDFLYIADASELPSYNEEIKNQLSAMVVIGNPPASYHYGNCSMILVPQETDPFQLYEAVNHVFYMARSWNADMQNIINNHGSLDALCATAERYFGNPLFIHNPNFYIVACNNHNESMDPWQKDERTGLDMLSADLITGFKMNPVYIDTLNKIGSQIFPADSTGYRIMYVNLWDDFGRYEGRICIDEIESAFQPGQLVALEHFGRMAMVLMQQRNFQTVPFDKPFERMIIEMVKGKKSNREYVEGILDTQGWKIHDSYRVFKMELDWRDHKTSSMVNTCNYIEGTIGECHAIQQENSILLILNLTKSDKEYNELMQILNRIVRESILMTGISNQFNDFCKLAYFYQQASLALHYGLKKNPTIWIHRFEHYVMDYCYDMVCKEIPAEYICAPQVLRLQEYDQEKNTELYETLKAYLSCVQNAEKTARELYIHRSTLFYRLRKIKEVTGLDLNEPDNWFYIQFSINLLEKEKNLKNA